MSEENVNPVGSKENAEQVAQSTQADSNVDYKALYHEEVENAKKQRHSKQELAKQLADIQREVRKAKKYETFEKEINGVVDGRLRELKMF